MAAFKLSRRERRQRGGGPSAPLPVIPIHPWRLPQAIRRCLTTGKGAVRRRLLRPASPLHS